MSHPSPDTKPRIRLLHQLARSGGTLISRCLGSMEKVCLLSEIHPDGYFIPQAKIHSGCPMKQAIVWHGLIDEKDLIIFRQHKPSFQQLMWLIEKRASERNMTLLIRDWSHMDWIGEPFYKPKYGSKLADCFKEYEVLRHCTVRHPIDQYLSLINLQIIFNSDLTIDSYLKGMLEFSKLCQQVGFSRYEDLTHDPDPHLKTICEALQIDFDPSYIDKWSSLEHITGDIGISRGGREAIRPLKRRAAPEDLINQFRSRESYAEIKDRLGYESD